MIFAGLPDRFESEGFDRSDMKMPEGHLRLIQAVSKANPDTVVVLLCGCAVECPWADQVKRIYVGYRYYEKAGRKVRWPFGFGLSYTTFSYSDIKIDGRNVSVTVTNTGNSSGAEVVLLYVAAPQTGIHRPIRELKGFQKIFLKPQESKRVVFQ